jgi:hypothetical protein
MSAQQIETQWDGPDRYQKMMRRVLCDWAAGIAAAFTVSPIIMTVDKAVVESASGTKSVWRSAQATVLGIAKSPIKFFVSREFGWIFFVYGSTYMAANSIDSICKITHTSDILPKLIGVTAVNMTASILKDRAFAYYFGRKVNNKVGSISLLLWLLRDVLTMAAAFVIPSRASKLIQEAGFSKEQADKVSLFSFPVFFQLFLTPVHLLGYDFYNYKDRAFRGRVDYLKPMYLSTVGIRMIRMGSAYGIGGVNNKNFRHRLISRFEGSAWDRSY